MSDQGGGEREWVPPPPEDGTPLPLRPRPPRRLRPPQLAAGAVALVVVLAATASLVVASGDDERPAPPASTSTAGEPSTSAPAASGEAEEVTAESIRAVEDDVERLRELDFRRSVPVNVEPPADVARQLLRQLDADLDEGTLRRQARALELLGQLPDDLDIVKLLRDVQVESVLGFYVPGDPPDGGKLWVRSDRGLDGYAEMVLAHELTHALTDQHFDLGYADELRRAGREDEATAYAALVEGDATLMMQRYLLQELDAVERTQAASGAAGESTPTLDAAPAVVREALVFPYQAGLAFVGALYQEGGWAAVDRAYRDPPTSTEQLLHPERYLEERDEPQRVTVADASGVLGAGWATGVRAAWGEFDVRILLQEEMPVTAAQDAAAGWDGGLVRTFERGGDTAMVLRTVWDSAAEADEYCDTMARWANERFGQGTGAGGGRGHWSGDGQEAMLACGGARSVWLSAPDRAALDRLAGAAGQP